MEFGGIQKGTSVHELPKDTVALTIVGWNWLQRFQLKINRLTAESMEFDLVGVDASIANAFRRILIAEVSMEYDTWDGVLIMLCIGSHYGD